MRIQKIGHRILINAKKWNGKVAWYRPYRFTDILHCGIEVTKEIREEGHRYTIFIDIGPLLITYAGKFKNEVFNGFVIKTLIYKHYDYYSRYI
jgi:hypothetical protein